MKKSGESAKSFIIKIQYDLFLSLWRFVKKHFFEIELFVVIAAVLSVYKRVPYVNLVVSPFMYYLVLTFIAIRLFSLTLKQISALIMTAFFVMAVSAVSHNSVLTEMLANVVFFVLCYLCMRMIMDMRKHL